MIDAPDYEALNRTESVIKQIHFIKYSENVFHEAGKGIAEENWNKMVESMGKFYKIPEDGIGQLKTASFMDDSKKNFDYFEIGGEAPGEFGYMRIAVQKRYGLMEYILAGTQIKFNLAPVTEEKKATVDLYFAKFEHIEGEAVLPQAVEENLKEYFINKALLAAGRGMGIVAVEVHAMEIGLIDVVCLFVCLLVCLFVCLLFVCLLGILLLKYLNLVIY